MVNSGHHPTVTQQYTRAIVRSWEDSGLPVSEGLQAIIDEIARHQRVPMPLQDRLWLSMAKDYPEPDLGLRLGHYVQPGNLDIVGFLLMSCDTLDDALEALVTYHPIVGEGGEFLMTEGETSCSLIYSPYHNICREIRVEAVLATLMQLASYLTDSTFNPSYISFQHKALMDYKHYEQVLGCPVQFEQVADAMVFPKAQLAKPLVQSNKILYSHMRQLADEALKGLQDHSIRFEVERVIKVNPNWGKEKVAEQFGISGRQLNRNLSREGVTFKLIADEVRLSMAREWLSGSLPVNEVAYRLGYHDESAFNKAFKRWTGHTPGEFTQIAS
ncbi:AraC family transcriptional regulator [Endozoicomonas ascidiicola]|uniref:AraC family transcriptional regulator n=1 Tax=Endozoicomonas ascidiicola TaxID=1698521 RepID=UPI000833D6CE|nr:AraC family transcriptional regulator [Endozoicomonas ascidiicola]